MKIEPPPFPTVSITLQRENAESLSFSLSDILCWLSGWNAAREGMGHDSNDPMGIEAIRELNILLKDALK